MLPSRFSVVTAVWVVVVVVAAFAPRSTHAGTVSCSFPANTDKYSLITKGDARVGAHNIYKGMLVGGTLSDGTPYESTAVDKTQTRVKTLASGGAWNWNGGLVTGATFPNDMFEQYEWLTRNVKQRTYDNNKKVVVKTHGGIFHLYNFNYEGQGYDNGNTVVFFNTQEDITIKESTPGGRQFGPTIIAPFSKVIVRGDAGFVDGLIVAKSFTTTGGNEGALQLHAAYYTGPLTCEGGVPAPAPVPVPVPVPVPMPVPVPVPVPTPTTTGSGYCNWNNCDGQVQGGDWCNANAQQCLQCGGTVKWCPRSAPVPVPVPAPVPTPTQGYCNWNYCNGVVEGGDWCNASGDRCKGCGGTWCPRSAPVKPPTRAPVKGPTRSPTRSPTRKPSKAPTKSPTKSPTKKPSKAPTKAPTKAPVQKCTKKPTRAPTKAPTKSPTKTPTRKPTRQPTRSPTRTPTRKPTRQPTRSPTRSPTRVPTRAPTRKPSRAPTVVPTRSPTRKPTRAPTKAPTRSPTRKPTRAPTKPPTRAPTRKPTRAPTEAPTRAPTRVPTRAPSKRPTATPSKVPTKKPSKAPTKAPTKAPSKRPTAAPSKVPTKKPTKAPTKAPTRRPSTSPTKSPTKAPTKSPTKAPTKKPTRAPTRAPIVGTKAPTYPTKAPSKKPTKAPTKRPTVAPTKSPTKRPTAIPTRAPTTRPTAGPTAAPTKKPSKRPTVAPTKSPTKKPSMRPTAVPTKAPTKKPSLRPTLPPTKRPSKAPTKNPTKGPTKSPTKTPTKKPSKRPTAVPTKSPTNSPTKAPTKKPSKRPSVAPSKAPTKAPVRAYTKSPTRAPVRVAYTKAPVTKRPTKAPSKAPTSAPTNVPCRPEIEINNLVIYGSDSALCDSPEAVEYVEGCPGTIITYCFEVLNTGCTHLNGVTITNPLLNFTSSEIGSLKPMESVIVSYTSKISSPLRNEAAVKGIPVLPDGKDIPNMPDVTDSDSSSVGVVEYKPAIAIDNKVYIGNDNGVSCGFLGVDTVRANISGTNVMYCFNVTNMGDTWLSGIKLVNAALNYTDNSIGLLAPRTSALVAYKSTIVANRTNDVVVTANPVMSDAMDIACTADVTATDTSHVQLVVGENKEAPKNSTGSCIEDKWKKNRTEDLVCTTKHVYLESIKSTKPLTCKPGEKVTVTVDSTMIIEGERNDLGWYVAVDGGDALTGTCVANGLQSTYSYVITDALSGRKTVRPVWAKQQGGDGDECGDVNMDYDKGRLNTPVLVNVQLPCVDSNEDGTLDAALCFTWRGDSGNKDECKLTENVPGSDCSCYCTRYDIENVKVEDPKEHPCE